MPAYEGEYIGQVVRCGRTYDAEGNRKVRYWVWTPGGWSPYERTP